jgi:hypothetical protein
LYASTTALIAAESQNVVRVRSTTNAGCSAASSRAARSPAALVTSISLGARTTATPLTISTGKPSKRICLTSRGRTADPYSIGRKPDSRQEKCEKNFMCLYSRE